MSYNPARAHGKARKTRKYSPHAGTKHSDILRRSGVGAGAQTQDRETTRHGFTSTICEFEGFTQRFVCLYSGNNTGIGVSRTGDRSVRVMSGVLYVSTLAKFKEVSEDGESEISFEQTSHEYRAGSTVNFERGTMYSLASSGTTDVEMIVTETRGYSDDWEELGESVVTKARDQVIVAPSATTSRRPRGESKAMLAAAKMSGRKVDILAAQERTKRNSSDNINSSTVVGVNPRPSGPPTDDE